MANPDRELTILLKLLADTAGATQVRAQLTALQSEQTKLQQQATSIGATELSTTQATAAAQQVLNGIMERRVIMETQLEAAEARIAGNPAMAAKLEREVAIRTQALNIQRTLNVTTEESIALAERLVLAQEASSIAAGGWGGNIAKTRQELLVLGREFAAGNVRASTLSSLLGSLGPALTVAGIAAFELYSIISQNADKVREYEALYRKQSDDLDNQIAQWRELAQSAGDFGDALQVGRRVQTDLDATAQRIKEFQAQTITWWDETKSYIASHPLIFGNPVLGLIQTQKSATDVHDETGEALAALQRKQLIEANKKLDAAFQSGAAWDATQLKPYDDAVADITGKIIALTERQNELNRARQVPDNATPKQVDDARKAFDELQLVNGQLKLQQDRLDGLQQKHEKLDQTTAKLTEEIQKSNFNNLDPEDRLAVLDGKVESIHETLREWGVDAATPEEALKNINQLSDVYRAELSDTIKLWVALLGLIRTANNEEGKSADKAVHDRVSASLREQSSLLQQIRQQQQLINDNPLLFADQKQALSRASMVAEMAALGGAIAQNKRDLANGPFDESTHEKLQAQIKKDQAAFEALGLRISAIDHPFGAELVRWVDSLGASAQGAARLITGTLQTALDGVSQSITGLITGTENWQQAWNSAVTSIIGSFVKFVVQFIAGQIAMFVIRRTLGTQEESITSKAAASSAAQWAPAAVSASIASYGAASGFGVAAYLAALALGEAAAAGLSGAGSAAGGGGFKRGGFTGDGRDDEYAGPVHRNEFVVNSRATRNIGAENLYALMHAAENAPNFATGGSVQKRSGHFVPPPDWYETAPDYLARNPILGNRDYIRECWRSFYAGDIANDAVDRWIAANDYDPPDSFDDPGSRPGYIPPPPMDFIPPENPISDPVGGDIPDDSTPPPIGPSDIPDGPPTPSITLFPGGGRPPGYHTTPPGGGPVVDIPPPYIGHGPPVWWSEPTVPTIAGLPWWSTFNPNLGPNLFTNPNDLGFGTRPTVTVSGPDLPIGYVNPNGDVWNGVDWTKAGPNPTNIGSDPYRDQPDFVDPVTGLAPTGPTYTGNPPSSFRPGRTGPGGGSPIGGAGVPTYTGDPGAHGRYNGSPGSTAGFFDPLFGDSRPELAMSGAQLGSLSYGLAFSYARMLADGGRIPGPASRADNILSWLSPGEHVIDAFTAQKLDRIYPDWPERLASMTIEMPRFADGGRAGLISSASSVSRGSAAGKMNIAIFDDRKDALRWLDSQEGRGIIINAVNGARHEIGLPAVN
jgi:hypothetical protein